MSGLFKIDPLTGSITTAAIMDREIWTQTIFQSKLKQQPIVVTPSKMHVILLTVCVSVGLKDLKQM